MIAVPYAVDVKAGNVIGVIAKVNGKEAVVRHNDINKPLTMDQVLHAIGKDKAIVVLKVAYPMQTSSRVVAVSGDMSSLDEGMPVYDGNEPVKITLIDNGDGTITDTSTGLIWMKNANPAAGEKMWNDAIEYCTRLEFAGKKDWRLPTKEEFESLIAGASEEQPWAVYLVDNGFTGICESYWTQTEHVNWENAWYVNMRNNSVYVDFKTNMNHVWPVRSADGDKLK